MAFHRCRLDYGAQGRAKGLVRGPSCGGRRSNGLSDVLEDNRMISQAVVEDRQAELV